LSRRPPQRIGRYRLVRRIGRGGSGDVYLARLEAPAGVHRLAAVKVLFHTGNDPRHHEALLAEARLGALLCHPNVAQVLDAGVDSGLSWFAMEFVAGLSFYELLEVGARPIPPWIAARIVADACAAVHALHEATDEQGQPLNVVHRDVTPHNLLVSWDGNVKLVDLGVAHSALRASVTRTGVVKGKLGYMSPEQASGAPVDRRCDVFALGVQLWEALAGRRLFKQQNDSETLASIVRGDIPSLRDKAGVPAALADIVAAALMVDRTVRIASALEMQRALETALGVAGVVVGASEVARCLAEAAPERVREHISWLRDVQKDGGGPSVEEPAGGSPPTARSVSVRSKRRSNALMWGATIVVLALATGTLMSRSAAYRGGPPSDAIAPPQRPAPPVMPAAPPAAAPPAAGPAPVAVGPATRKPSGRRTAADGHATARAGVGTLYVSASPNWATISLDGKPAGTTPTVFSDLPAGTHVIEALPLGKGPSMRKKVIVAPGGTARIGFDFEEP
jgi:serine/threonine-protein kinase